MSSTDAIIEPVVSNVSAETAESAATVKKPRAPKKEILLPAKIVRKLESLEAKNVKLLDDYKKLKAEHVLLKSASTRPRKIPKKPVVAPVAE